jgi:hypothetical protein
MKSLVALVGMKHRGTEEFVASLPQGETLTLVREPDNKFDPNAVQVWARDRHVGYVKAAQVGPVAMALDRVMSTDRAVLHEGKPAMLAKLAIDGGRWPMVEVEA